MHINFEDLQGSPLPRDSIVIVGSGAVGLYLAAILSREGKDVILLESGSKDLGGFDASSFQSIGKHHDGIGISRSRTLGGTTNLWGGQLVELMKADFGDREWHGGEGWPIEYSDLAQYYNQTYESLGIDRSVWSDDDVWQTLRAKKPILDNGLEVFFTRWMRVPNLAVLFQKRITNDPHLLAVTGCTAVGFTYQGNRVDSLLISDGNGGRTQVHGCKFILAAGTIENARLMLHATVSSPGCPWINSPMLGQRFQDHLGGRIADIFPEKGSDFFNVFSTVVSRGQKLQPKIRTTDQCVSQNGQLNIQGMMAFENSISENLVFLKQFTKAALFGRQIGSLGGLARNSIACSRYLIPLIWKYIVDRRILVPGGSRISLHVQSETFPNDESRISINANSLDRFGLPKVILDWRVSGDELSQIRVFAERASQAFLKCGLASVKMEPSLASENTEFLDRMKDTGHQAGGCVMGTTSQNGVVDKNLQVFGTENLFILGASVFRTSGNANTTFTAMTLATRLKDFLTN